MEVPHVRIVKQTLWDRVEARQTALDANAKPASDGSMFQSKQRVKYLFSGLIRCGACSGGMSMISSTHLGCSNTRNRGEALCKNRRNVEPDDIDGTVLQVLRTRLMAPEIYDAFVRALVKEWNQEQGQRASARTAGWTT